MIDILDFYLKHQIILIFSVIIYFCSICCSLYPVILKPHFIYIYMYMVDDDHMYNEILLIPLFVSMVTVSQWSETII